jgi:membrane-bound lytic murein transglycosylase MltF
MKAWLPAVLLVALCVMSGASAAVAPPPAREGLSLRDPGWIGDFDGMLERRAIRVLVPYSRTLFFYDAGHEYGLTAGIMREFERYLNKRYAKQLGRRPLTLFLVPTTRDRLIDGVARGAGDIAAGSITITPARAAKVDFVPLPTRVMLREVVVTGPGAPPLASLEDLSGKRVHVRPATSYADSLGALNERLRAAGRPPVELVPLPDALEDEDKLEMLNAGILDIVIVDRWLAKLWRGLLPKIKVHEHLAVRDDGVSGWAVRQGSEGLKRELDAFFRQMPRNAGSFEYRVGAMQRRLKQIRNNTARADLARFQRTIALFDKYGDRYGFDSLMLAAQGYQESRLRQEARSKVGAIGVMQVMPATGRELGVGDITVLEPNIHAGTKYLRLLMSRHFADAKFDELNRPLFAFASYNAGPNAIKRMRRIAAERGLDPDQWFNHVEVVTAERIGQQPTTYVRNIYKYYVAYSLIEAARRDRGRHLENLRR